MFSDVHEEFSHYSHYETSLEKEFLNMQQRQVMIPITWEAKDPAGEIGTILVLVARKRIGT